jgi:hypothetical protein
MFVSFSRSSYVCLHVILVKGWVNPHEKQEIHVTASSIEKGSPHHLVDHEPSELWSKDVPASWFCVNLGAKRTVSPTYYTVRHGRLKRAVCECCQVVMLSFFLMLPLRRRVADRVHSCEQVATTERIVCAPGICRVRWMASTGCCFAVTLTTAR